MIFEQDRRPGVTQVPFDVIGEHAQKDVGADPRLDPVVNGMVL
jgi:hypothetical protein